MLTVPTPNERNLAMAVHVAAVVLAFLTAWAAGIAGVLAAGVVYFVRPMNSDFIAHHAKEALNFNLTMFLLSIIAAVLVIFTLGLGLIIVLPLAALLAIAWLHFSIMAAVAASRGQTYRFPFSFRLFS